MNLLRKPSCGTRLCLRRQGRLANRRPLRHPRLAASATGGASAAMPDTLRAPRLHPQSLRKKRDKQTLVSLFLAGAEGLGLACRLGRLVACVPLALAHPSARGFGVDVGKCSKEQGRAGVARFLPQVRKGAVLIWCCEEILRDKDGKNIFFLRTVVLSNPQ